MAEIAARLLPDRQLIDEPNQQALDPTAINDPFDFNMDEWANTDFERELAQEDALLDAREAIRRMNQWRGNAPRVYQPLSSPRQDPVQDAVRSLTWFSILDMDEEAIDRFNPWYKLTPWRPSDNRRYAYDPKYGWDIID